MTPTQQQIQHAWQQLDDGAALEEIRANWNKLVQLRFNLDACVYALAVRIDELRHAAAVAEPENETPDTPDEEEPDDAEIEDEEVAS